MIKQAQKEREREKTTFDVKQRQYKQKSSDAREHFHLLVLIKKMCYNTKIAAPYKIMHGND